MALIFCAAGHAGDVVVGSKNFTEGFVLGEWLAGRIAELTPVERRFGLGGTGVVFPALLKGEVDCYVEYTGTIAEVILKKPRATRAELVRGLAALGVVMSESLGFQNDYALAVSESFARSHHLRRLSDLKRVRSRVRAAFSYEFIERKDGLRGLVQAYELPELLHAPGIEHALAFEAVARGRVDLIDVYTTDAKIERLGLRVLEDDRTYFPSYEAVILTRADLAAADPAWWKKARALAGTLDASMVRRWNARVEMDRLDARAAVEGGAKAERAFWWPEISRRAIEHGRLVGISLTLAILIGIPSGVWAYRRPRAGRWVVLGGGVVQTIPSLALLCFLIPLIGIGTPAALVALTLYGLFPIVEGTRVGLESIEPKWIEMAEALDLTPWQRLRHVEFPLAARSILSGVKTSAVIGIGTATMAALIGAGGFGATITAGLAINDPRLVWAGALPAAAMALGVQALFYALQFVVIAKGLRSIPRGESK